MTLILDSLTENKDRDDLKYWVIYLIEEEPSFDLNKPDIFIKFLDKLKEKFDVSNWDKTKEVWKDFLNFKANEDEDTKRYLMRFQELESRMRDVGNMVPDTFMAHS